MQTIGIVLNVDTSQSAEFERGFRAEEAPIWADLNGRGLLVMATLTRLDITTMMVDGAVQYLVVAIFATDEGHHVHDQDPASTPGTSGPIPSRLPSPTCSEATRSSTSALEVQTE